MLTKTPKGGFYWARRAASLNAIAALSIWPPGRPPWPFLLSLPLALYLNLYKGRGSKTAAWTRFLPGRPLGVPSIVYGAFGFIVMLALGLRASLLAGT